jgi:protein gp37
MKARVAFRGMSCEPLLEYTMNLHPWLQPNGRADLFPRLDWLFIGGESGRRPRGLWLHAVRGLIRQARYNGVPVFVKQLGSRPISDDIGQPIILGDAKGGDPREWAADLRVRDYPRLKFELQPASTEA